MIEREKYVQKVKKELNNQLYYKKLHDDPTSSLRTKKSKLIKSWNSRGVFDQLNFPISIETNLDHNVISRAYGLIKVHKEGMPARIIVSTLNSPLINLFLSFSTSLYRVLNIL